MKYNHFSMLPERAFQQRPFAGMTLEGGLFGGGGGGGGGEPEPEPTRHGDPRPIAPYISAQGGFQGRGAPSVPIGEAEFDAERYLKQNPDVAKDPYYGKNPYHHYVDFGFAERRSPSENFQYLPSQQPQYNEGYAGRGGRPDLVSAAYERIVGRTPDEEGFKFWTEQMNKGLTGQGLVGGFTGNPEFQRTREFERAYTEAFRPGYKEFGPSGQYYQPIYQSSYQGAQQPARFYAPSYDMPAAVNPFDYSKAPAKGEAKGEGSDSGSK